MTHKISPFAFRLGVSSSWLSQAHFLPLNSASILSSDLFLRNLIQGVFLNFGIFTSPIIIKRSPSGSIHIHLFFWDSSPSVSPSFSFFHPFFRNDILKFKGKKNKVKIISLFLAKLLSKILNLPYPSPLHFHFSEIPSPVFNAKILSDYLAYRISLNPYFHKSVVMEALRASLSF